MTKTQWEYQNLPRERNEREFRTRVERRYENGAKTRKYRRGCYDATQVIKPETATERAGFDNFLGNWCP